jgi:hypothetical protein
MKFECHVFFVHCGRLEKMQVMGSSQLQSIRCYYKL